MSQRKKLRTEIDALVQHIHAEKKELSEHQHYFSRIIRHHPSTVLILLFPAFLLGFRQARQIPKGKRIQGFARFLLTTIFTHLRRHILP